MLPWQEAHHRPRRGWSGRPPVLPRRLPTGKKIKVGQVRRGGVTEDYPTHFHCSPPLLLPPFPDSSHWLTRPSNSSSMLKVNSALIERIKCQALPSRFRPAAEPPPGREAPLPHALPPARGKRDRWTITAASTQNVTGRAAVCSGAVNQ